MKKPAFLKSLNDATEGFIYVVNHERNMRAHFLFGFLVLLLAIFLGVSRLEWIILCAVTTLVFTAEMFNTAIEETLDLLHSSTHRTIRVIKDVSAAAVLVTSLNALVVGFVIFSKHWSWPVERIASQVRYGDWPITFAAFLAVVFFVISGKAFFRHGTPFRGGAVSGHAAIAFSVWTAILLAQNNVFVTGVTFLLALLVAQSRLRAKIHSFWEVVAGAVIGFLVTAFFFQLFR